MENATTKQLTEFYNTFASKPVSKFNGVTMARQAVEELIEDLELNPNPDFSDPSTWSTKPVVKSFQNTMSTSLKLDRTVRHVETGETYKNCFRLFTEAKLLTNAQSDKLSGILYKEAKQGIKVTFSFGEGLTFELVNVPGAK